MVSNTRFKLNSDEVVSKVIDGEAIIMNLTNGVYYSTAALGAEIWTRVIDEESVDDIASDLGHRYPDRAPQTTSDLTGFVEQLVSEGLVLPVDGQPASSSTPSSSERSTTVGDDDLQYESPTLVVYRDMGDLLALDPPQPGLEKTAWKDTDEDQPGGNAG